jgi:hypothetical protein
MKQTLFPFIIFILATLFSSQATGEVRPSFVLKGHILDNDRKPVEGGEVFVYATRQIRRPADFISPKSDRDGLYRTELPAGHYWVVARVRSGAGYGPLSIGKRHSGEAREIEGDAGNELPLDFIVADVREMARSQRKTGDDFIRVEGRILDRDSKPAAGVYAFARGEKSGTRLPEFISPLSDIEGRYVIYIPAGRYCLGTAAVFPPEEEVPCTELLLKSTTIDIAKDLQLHYSDKKIKEEGQGGPDAD